MYRILPSGGGVHFLTMSYGGRPREIHLVGGTAKAHKRRPCGAKGSGNTPRGPYGRVEKSFWTTQGIGNPYETVQQELLSL